MPRCATHPDVETNLQCVSCDRYICPKEMVSTAVGYKCPQCAAPPGVRIGGMKGRQLGLAVACALGAGIVGGLVVGQLLTVVHFLPWLFSLLFGAAVGEAARRGSGGHRTPPVAAVAVLGAFIGGFGLFGVVLAGVGAGGGVLANRF